MQMTTPKHQVHNLIILDESGSMESIKVPTVQSFNEIIQTMQTMELKFPEQEHRVSLISFNGAGRVTHLWNQAVKTAGLLDWRNYNPNASTPLYDAMGYGMTKLAMEVEGTHNYDVLVTVFTDGEENASREWSGTAIKELIEKLKLKNWTFTYVGADHDVTSEAGKISIENARMFHKSAAGMDASLRREKAARLRFSEKIRANESRDTNFYE